MNRIAIIGHGASPAGKGWGSRIDSMPVVRMHDHGWQSIEDYGTRFDYGILPGPWFEKALTDAHRAPSEGWLCYVLPTQKPKRIPPMIDYCPVFRADAAVAEFARPMLPTRPTRGVAGAIVAGEVLQPDALVLVGFDSIFAEQWTPHAEGSDTPPKFEGPALYDANGICHDFRLERAALLSWARSRGVALFNGAAATEPHPPT